MEEVDWDRLDKVKFTYMGLGLFSGVTTCLFPLTVVKTRQMSLDNAPRGLSGAVHTAKGILAADGVRGLYRGFGTVVFGMIPARIAYLTTLEAVKGHVAPIIHPMGLSDAATAGATNFVAGGTASMATQAIIVPIDVVSQRLMLEGSGSGSGTSTSASGGASGGASRAAGAASSGGGSGTAAAPAPGGGSAGPGLAARGGAGPASGGNGVGSGASSMVQGAAGGRMQRMSGPRMAQLIVRQEGVRGLYRGMGASLATFVPSSAVWWSAYAFYQRHIWQQIDSWRGLPPSAAAAASSSSRGSGAGGVVSAAQQQQQQKEEQQALVASRSRAQVVGVQTLSALMGGCTAALLTNPLDVIKTRLQTAKLGEHGAKPSWLGTARRLVETDGLRFALRGVVPRMASSALWGTAMVTCYEQLKRMCTTA